MENKFKIRLATESDKDEVLILLNRVFEKQQRSQSTRDERYWHWKFRNSVFGPSILTVAEDAGKIVGFDHLWPWELCFEGKTLKAVQPCDTAVYEDYRGKELFKQMRMFGLEEAIQRDCQLVFNFPNENSLPGNRSLGAKYLGKITWWVRVLRPVHLVVNKLFDLKETSFILPKEYRLDNEYLDWLANVRQPDESFIQIHRLPGFHQWRYLDHPTRKYGIVKIREGNKESALIFTVVQNGASLEMVIVDFVGDICTKKKVIQSMLHTAKQLDTDFIAVMNNDLFEINGLWKYKFIKKKLKNMVVMPLDSVHGNWGCSFDYWGLVAGFHDSI